MAEPAPTSRMARFVSDEPMPSAAAAASADGESIQASAAACDW